MDSITITLVGSSGLVGGELLAILPFLQEVDLVKAVSRSPLGRLPPRSENIVMSLDDLEARAEFLKADVFICCLGTTIKKAGSQEAFRKVDYEYVVDFAKVAAQVGAKKLLVVSAMGANAHSRIFYNRVKGEMEEAIKALAIPQVEIFRPSLILGERKEARTGEDLAQKLYPVLKPLLLGPLKKYRAISATDIARAMAIATLNFHPGQHTYESQKIQAIADQI